MTAQQSIVEEREHHEHVDFYSLQAQRALGIPDWRWCELRAVEPNGILMRGGVYRVMFKSGPRKGTPNFSKPEPKTEKQYVTTQAEADAFKSEWEAETGKCMKCSGTKRAWAGWGIDTGHRYRDCERCNATGKAPTHAR